MNHKYSIELHDHASRALLDLGCFCRLDIINISFLYNSNCTVTSSKNIVIEN